MLDWPEGTHPYAPSGFYVHEYASGLNRPGNLIVADNGDVFVAESQSITLLRDSNGDGHPEVRSAFLSGLDRPYGMAINGNQFLVACSGGVDSYAYTAGQLWLSSSKKRILQLPAGGSSLHWQRNLLLDQAQQKLYVTVGSATSAGEAGMQKEYRRANILEVDIPSGAERVYASGLAGPLGLDWSTSGQLWSVVAASGSGKDYVTSIQNGAFYGWPKRESSGPPAVAPDLPLSDACEAQGLSFYRGRRFPSHYRDGAFVSLHGTARRSGLSGFKVIFIPFLQGLPAGPPEDFLIGFVPDHSRNQAYGRPSAVGVAWDGSLLISDDGGNRIWRVSR